jgi:hypothetical protein
LLNTHPQIVSIGEVNGLVLKDAEHYMCSCGKMIRKCEFWQAMTREMTQRGCDFDVADFQTEFKMSGPSWIHRLRVRSFGNQQVDSLRDTVLRTLPSERRQLQQLVSRNCAFVESALKLTGKRIFVDTSKDHLRARALKMFSNYDVRVIHLVRDPRGVTASKIRRGVRITPREAARQWVRLHTRLQNLPYTLSPGNYLRVRYEDVCRDPASLLKKLYAFCGADPEAGTTDYRAAPHHIVGNPMRLEKLSVIKLDERWRELLSQEQQQEVWQVAGRLGSLYGYTG